ncbi:MAG: guanylate kinase [Oscillospiraceae bacterium]|nr:guanylate kinase [Oscillospiraceae bacterium]MDD6502368.1 guanylate kinase [Oscillospiraceae bacterium]MDY4105163.1 guanylate kinase [Oscillospiraceae bacterium]
MSKGKLLVLSGPSGAGKSTVVSKLMERRGDVCFSVSATTRAPRPGEQDGVNYFFVTRERFEEMVRTGELLEHAEYVGNCYGTPRAYVEQRLEAGYNVILDIEVQGARQVMEAAPEAVLVFLIPPTLAELERRLRARGTESDEVIRGRLERAKEECRSDFYRYIVINDDADTAAKELDAIITAEQCSYNDRKTILKEVYES